MTNTLLKKLATISSMFVALILLSTKFVVFLLSGSLMVLSSAVDSLLDLTTSLVNFLAVKYSAVPKDEDHKFGHDAVEDIAGLIQGGFICFSGGFIIFRAIVNLIQEQRIVCDSFCIGIMGLSLVLTIALVIFQNYVIKKTRSIVIKADSLHYKGDILMNIIFIVSLLMINHNPKLYFLDPLMAILVGFYILKSACGISKNAFDNLMGKEIAQDQVDKIVNAINSEKRIVGFHELRTRKMGNKVVVQVHIELDKNLSFEDAHDITHKIEKKILSLFEECEVIIHADPVDE